MYLCKLISSFHFSAINIMIQSLTYLLLFYNCVILFLPFPFVQSVNGEKQLPLPICNDGMLIRTVVESCFQNISNCKNQLKILKPPNITNSGKIFLVTLSSVLIKFWFAYSNTLEITTV